MARLSTTAWVLQDLGLAAGFGGTLFGQLALYPAVNKMLESQEQRNRLSRRAWRRYRTVNALGLTAIAGTWVAGRLFLSRSGAPGRALTLLKDGLVAGALASGIGALVTGTRLNRAYAGAARLRSGSKRASQSETRVSRLERAVRILGALNVAFEAGVIVATTLLAMTSARSARWDFVSRLLP